MKSVMSGLVSIRFQTLFASKDWTNSQLFQDLIAKEKRQIGTMRANQLMIPYLPPRFSIESRMKIKWIVLHSCPCAKSSKISVFDSHFEGKDTTIVTRFNQNLWERMPWPIQISNKWTHFVYNLYTEQVQCTKLYKFWIVLQIWRTKDEQKTNKRRTYEQCLRVCWEVCIMITVAWAQKGMEPTVSLDLATVALPGWRLLPPSLPGWPLNPPAGLARAW